MPKPKSLLFVLLTIPFMAMTQEHRVHGKITNNRMEPLAFVSVQVKDLQMGTTTKEDGSYELLLADGKWDLVITMIGYKPQILTIVVKKENYLQNVVMEFDESKNMNEVVIKGKVRDRAEEFIRNVIRNKEKMVAAAGDYSCQVYIKAVQQDSSLKKKKRVDTATVKNANADLVGMAMAEIVLNLDQKSSGKIKEERTGVKKRGSAEGLFFLSTTEGDFSLYSNLIKVPAISQVLFLSPVSYSGLVAYRFKVIKTSVVQGRKVYTISFRPTKLSNATVEGEVDVADSVWTILKTKFRFPSNHLPEYDFFEVQQHYELVNAKAWMMTRQQFTYYSKTSRLAKSGETVVVYKNFELNKTFNEKHFGVEVSSTSGEAYEKDTSFWKVARAEPLTNKEVRFIHYKDSVYRATHTKAYLDSMDKLINKITWKNVLLNGQSINNHEKQSSWSLPPLASLYQPFQFGGSRFDVAVFHNKIYKSRKNISVFADVSYGLRNKDVNGTLRFSRMYNPFNRGYYTVEGGREFEFIFEGDAWINMLKRTNVYLANSVKLHHGLELLNGLMLTTGTEIGLRKSVSNYETNAQVDSLFGSYLGDNQAKSFEGYNAFYADVKLSYTPKQKYIREPKEKIILGSSWPTVYASLRKGVPSIFKSTINFAYLEFGLQQEVKLGLSGISRYTVKSGSFVSKKDLPLVDYQWQRRGDPFLFMNPDRSFQALDSTFATFKRFYAGHYVHEFNGMLLSKIPLLKKLNLREVVGGGFLIAQERNLRYVEGFAGVERIFKWPFNPLSKFKLGVYVVGSAANQFKNPVQFKIGITSWDKRRNRWF